MSEQSNLSNFGTGGSVQGDQVVESDLDDEKLYRNEEWLQKQYCENELTQTEIADKVGVSHATVGKWMRRHEIESRSAAPQTDGNPEPLRNGEWLREQYCEQEKSSVKIADELGVDSKTVRNWMQKHGIDRRSAAEARTDGNLEKLKNREWLREQYWEQEKTLIEIADELGLNNTTIKEAMQKHGIDRRSLSESHTEGNLEKLKDREWLREQYWEQDKTTHEIADELSLSQATVSVWMEKHGTERRSAGQQTDGNLEKLKDREWLRDQYCEQRKTTNEIADELGLSQATVRRWMIEHGIDRRSAAEAQTDGDLERLKNEEWLREQYSERERTRCEIADELNLCQSVVTRALKNHGIEIRSLHMDPDYLPHHVIGELELTTANYLHDSQINYGYETLKIECGKNRAYIPDFVTENYVIECKGTDWGKVYDSEVTAEQKAEAAMKQLDEREYVVVGIQLPCDIHIPREEHGTIQELFE